MTRNRINQARALRFAATAAALLGFALGGTARAAETLPPGSYKITTERGPKYIDVRPVPSVTAPLPKDGPAGPAAVPLPAPLTNTFKLHSRPTATKVIYLDFDGHVGLDGTYQPFNFEGTTSSFSSNELTRIQEVWLSVAEDFMPFDVDVTTQQPPIDDLKKSGTGDTRWGVRAVIASAPWDYSWAYVNSFNSSQDQEVYAYTGDFTWIWIADSISHEVGHSLGLDEHGQQPGDGTYYEGHGSGNTYWAPIMGWTKMSTPYGLSQWDKGEYLNADHSEDSLNIITTKNGFGYRPDDHGSTTGTATPMVLPATPAVVAEGLIEQRTDVDCFSFTMPSTGAVSLVINGDVQPSDANHRSSNLDVLAKLYNSGGTVLYTSNPPNEIYASFSNVALAAGTYYLSIDGTGLNNPTNGYSDYGSLGYYSIAGSMTGGSPSIGGYNVYYGQLHSHTSLSDGTGTPAQAYVYARDTAGLDFFSIADHCSYPYNGMMTVAEYQALQTTANSYNQDGTFVTFWGFEWTSDDTSWGGPATLLGKGHLTVINATNFCRATDEASNDLNELVSWISARDVVAFFNHPGEYGYNFDNFNFTNTDKIVGMELWGRSIDYYGSGTWYHDALGKGWYIGAEGSQDNHSADWGALNEWRMAILATNKTRATLFAAMKARRFYSSRDKNLALSFQGNGAEMGSRIPAGPLSFRIEATDGDNETFTRVELVKNGTIVNTWTNSTTHPLVTNVTTGAQGDYFYAKVFQGASWTAISSPIFIIQAVPNSNAFLANLVPSAGTLSPAFASNIVSYTASVPYATTSMTVTPTALDPGAAIKVNGNAVASGSPSASISLSVGANVITNVVVSADTTVTNTYTLTVTRPAYLTWDANAATAGQTDGTGTWTAANQWWDGAANVTWANGNPAVIGNGGAGGTITLGAIDAVSVTLTNFTGTYTLSGGSLTNSGGITLATNTVGKVTISTPVAGAGGITKNDSGTLTLQGANTFTGRTTVNAGTLQLTHTNAIATSSALTNANGSTLALRSDTAATFTTPGNGTNTFGQFAGGATNTIDVNNLTSGSGNTLRLSGGIGSDTTGKTTTTLNITGGNNGYVLRAPLTLKRTSSATAALTLNPTTASMIVDGLYMIDLAGGSLGLTLGGTNTGANEVTGTLTGTGFTPGGQWLVLTKNTAAKWKWSVNTTTTPMNSSSITAGDLIVTGTLMGQVAATLTLSGGTLHYNSATAVSANGAFKWSITGGNLDNTSGAAITSTGNPTMTWGGNFTFLGSNGTNSDLNLGNGAVTNAATRQITIQNAATALTVGGTISGAGGLTKAGPGKLKLSGTNTYTGATTVSAGTLLINGSLSSSTVTMATNATLGGTGTIAGIVTNNAGGTLSPGTSIGTLTLTNKLVLLAGSTNTFEVNGSIPTNDVIVLGVGVVTYGGVLNIVTNGTFTLGQTFTLFKGAGATNTGNFASLAGSPGAGKAFSFTNGVLTVVSTGPTLTSVSPNPVTGSSYPVTLGLTGSGFSGSPAVLLTNLTAATGASYVPTVNSATSISASFVPGTAATSWNATVVNGTPSAQVPFTVTAPTVVTINTANLASAGAGKVVLSGTGGTPGYSYAVVIATNLNSPVVWSPVVTNTFDGGGNFSYTNTVSLGTPQLFLRLQQ